VQLGYSQNFAKSFAQVCLIVASFVSLIAILQSIIGLPASIFLLPENVEIGGVLVRMGARQFLAERTRVFSTLGRYDTLGTYLSILILLITSLYWARAIPKKYYYWFAMLSLSALILSYSRQSWLVTMVGFLILMVLHKKFHYLFSLGVFSAITILVLLVFFSGYIYYSSDQANVSFLNRILEPFSQRYLEISRYSYGRLFVIFEVSRRILDRAPLLGFGPGNFGTLTARFLGRDFSSLIDLNPESARLINDVNWVTILGQVGLIGTILFGIILILMIVRSRKIFRLTEDPVLRGYAGSLVAILVAFIIMGFFGPNFEVRQVSFFVWAIAGIVFSIRISRIASLTTK
jgi:O-antigen ligase